MPTYDYVCDACDHKFELFQSIKAEPEKKCPQCKKLKLRRLFGIGAGIVFKGSGFYQTDYRSEGYKKKAEAESKESSSSATSSSGESKTDSSSSNGSDASTKAAPPTKSAGGKSSKKAAGSE